MLLGELLEDDSLPQIEITDVTCDSRKVKDGSLFFALPGAIVDGIDFIDDAVKKGASAVIVKYNAEIPEEFSKKHVIVEHKNPRRAYSQACFNFFGAKSPANITVVTGTNGKTSIVNFARQIWEQLGFNSASIGTIGVVTKDSYVYGERTTPDSKELYKTIAGLADKGITHLAIEGSSHGIIQNRLDDLFLKGAGWTNLTPEHLDYHDDMKSYYHAKARLFTDILPAGETAVLNTDTEEFVGLRNICIHKGHSIIDYGEKAESIKIIRTKPLAHGQEITFNFYGKEYSVEVGLVGDFQASNLACAMGLVLVTNPELKETPEKIMETLPKIIGVDGRMELVGKKANGANIYIDYAHSPDGVEKMLKAIRPHVPEGGRLICVFGCGGDRDKTKRPVMGRLVEDLADVGIVADDNPRTENPITIREEIMVGCPSAMNVGDRSTAIKQAIDMLNGNDLLIIAGKGHEIGQDLGTKVIHFSDKEEVQKFI